MLPSTLLCFRTNCQYSRFLLVSIHMFGWKLKARLQVLCPTILIVFFPLYSLIQDSHLLAVSTGPMCLNMTYSHFKLRKTLYFCVLQYNNSPPEKHQVVVSLAGSSPFLLRAKK